MNPNPYDALHAIITNHEARVRAAVEGVRDALPSEASSIVIDEALRIGARMCIRMLCDQLLEAQAPGKSSGG